MLDMGFIHDIRKIVAKLPTERQTLFFSATMPQQIADLARQMLRDPVKVSVTPAATTVDRVAQRVIHVDRAGKAAMLADLLRKEPIDRALVFTRTKHGADKVVRMLVKSGIAAQAIHGNKSQSQRERVLAEFRTGKIRTLIATDIAARGIDVDGISHVINYDLPNEPESYVHRIGRTARAGATGIAISLCDHEEAPYLRAIEKLIRLTIPSEGYRPTARPHQGAGGNDGPRPHEGRSNGDRSHGDRHRGGRQRSQRPQGNRPQGEPSNGHRAQAGRPADGGGRSNESGRNRRGGHGAGQPHRERAQTRGDHRPSKPDGHPHPAASEGAGISGVGFMQRPVSSRRDDAGHPPR